VRTDPPPGGTTPGKGEPRFPGYDVLGQRPSWDPVTTSVVLARLHPDPNVRFFSGREARTAQALLNRLLAQDDEPRVPVFEVVDRRLAERDGDGYRYEDMPEDPEAWRGSLAGLDRDAQDWLGLDFADLAEDDQRDVIERVRLCEGSWHGLPAARVFSLWMRYACGAFYAHPWAWNEMGFGGPAYPRGYKHLALSGREPWEVQERDAHDPVPWAKRAEDAKRRHAEGLSGQREESK
jgi:Gluconate 2-dehydrogenase subunit 3